MSTRIKEHTKSVAKRPIKTAGYSHAKADARQALRRRQAEARQAAYAALNPVERATRDAELRRIYITDHNTVPGI